VSSRDLSAEIIKDLKTKMVFLSGPRQCGKTTLSKQLFPESFEYLSWDIPRQRKIITDIAWDKTMDLIVLDELHKFKKWKNFLKGIHDEFLNKPPILVTGSARLDTFRNKGDALTGRFFHYRLHPIDVNEGCHMSPKATPDEICNHLLKTGGFPESFFNPKSSAKLNLSRFDLVLDEDLRDLSKTNSVGGIRHLIEILRERVGQIINYDNISSELGVSAPTVKSWIVLLERLYLIFRVSPYSYNLSRSLKKDSKYYFYDCSAAPDNPGAALENLAACALYKYCQWQRDCAGLDYQLMFYRDKDKREVDFVVTHQKKVESIIEVKSSDTKISESLHYLKSKCSPKNSLQLMKNHYKNLEKNGVQVVKLANWLAALK
jgi:uncharacterized protein